MGGREGGLTLHGAGEKGGGRVGEGEGEGLREGEERKEAEGRSVRQNRVRTVGTARHKIRIADGGGISLV